MKSSESKVGKRHSNLNGFNREIHAFIIYILRKNANELHPLSPNEILQNCDECLHIMQTFPKPASHILHFSLQQEIS